MFQLPPANGRGHRQAHPAPGAIPGAGLRVNAGGRPPAARASPQPDPPMMPLEVKLFARARDLAGAEVVRLTPPPATVGELRRRLAEEFPPLAALLERCAIAVDH